MNRAIDAPREPVSRKLLERVLILAPTGDDAAVTAEVLGANALAAKTVPDVMSLCREIARGAGAVIVTSEALGAEAVELLVRTLRRQPAWSELPILVFAGPGQQSEEVSRAYEVIGERGHLTLIDRPIHVQSLVSVTSSALQARKRQYEIRDLLHDLENSVLRERRHADRLSGLAQASLAIASAGSLSEVLKIITEQARRLLSSDLAVTRAITDRERGTAMSVLSLAGRVEPWVAGVTLEEIDATDVVDWLAEPLRVRPTEPVDPEWIEALFANSPRRPPLAGLLAVPLVEQQEAHIGFIAVSNKGGGYYTDEDQAVLVQLGQMASAVVQKARLYREAQDANRAKDDFLATLAHELRTPMTSILGWVQMLKEDDSGEDVQTAIEMIESSTRVQAQLVDDLLDVSRIITGKLAINPAPTELRPLVENIIATFRNAAEEGGITLVPELEESPLSVWGDATRLQQIIWNLLSNAIKFTPEGGRVSVKLARENGAASIVVSDTGEGIASDFLPHVFERFRQAESGAHRRSHSGLGLGLAIVKHLVEAHGGTIEAESGGIGTGARFRVLLPLDVLRPSPPEDVGRVRRNLDGRRFLIVDDDVTARTLLEEVLAGLGVDVRAAGSVREAVDLLAKFDADLVISDLAMPGEDGYALIGRLRHLGRDVPAVAFSGYGRPEDRVRALGSGFRHFVQKPVELATLARIAADVVGPS